MRMAASCNVMHVRKFHSTWRFCPFRKRETNTQMMGTRGNYKVTRIVLIKMEGNIFVKLAS
jgi:hypothetical protein